MRRPIKNGVEVLDSRTLRLNLGQPVLSVAEDCGEYCALVVHPSFKAPLSQQSHRYGALYAGGACASAIAASSSASPRRRMARIFVTGAARCILDEIHFYHYEQDNQAAALASGSVDAIYELTVEQIELARSIPGAQILSVETAQTLCCRMQVDVKPFDDIRVRRAVVKAADNAAIKKLVFGEHGTVADNFHVAPVHPEYFPLPPAGARRCRRKAASEGSRLREWHRSRPSSSATTTVRGTRRRARRCATR